MQEVLFQSKSEEWATPQEFFGQLHEEFNFTLDPCCTEENKKCDKYYTKEVDGLSQDWSGEVVFCNPPYGRKVGAWVKKCAESKCLAVALLPARTDTRWFHDYIYNKAEIRFIKGRLRFGGGKNSAPFPSMVVIWKEA